MSKNPSNRSTLLPAAATSGFVEVDGLRLHHVDYGTPGRPEILCVHGGAANTHWYDFAASDLSRDYHMRALDQRGHGESAWADPPLYTYPRYAQDLSEVIRQLDLRDFVLIGHSMGGLVSLVCAATYPERIARLIIVDSTFDMSGDRVAAMRNFGTREPRTHTTREEFIAAYRMRPAASPADPSVMRHIALNSGRQGSDGLWRHKFDRNVYGMREPMNAWDCWSRIKVPALLVKCSITDRINPEVFSQVRARCPQVELAEVPGTDHHVMVDNPEGFAQVVRAFLDRHPLT